MVPTNKRKAWYCRETCELVYLHVPKCGSFVEKVFRRQIAKCPTQALPDAAGHLTYVNIPEYLPDTDCGSRI